MCGSRKYPYFPHRRDWKLRVGGGVSKSQKFKAMHEAKLEFLEEWGGGGVIGQIPSVGVCMCVCVWGGGGAWIFSGTTQWLLSENVQYLYVRLVSKLKDFLIAFHTG